MRQGLARLTDDLFGLLNQLAVQLPPSFFGSFYLFLCVLSNAPCEFSRLPRQLCPGSFHNRANGLRNFARTLYCSFQHAHTICQLAAVPGWMNIALYCCPIRAQFLPFRELVLQRQLCHAPVELLQRFPAQQVVPAHDEFKAAEDRLHLLGLSEAELKRIGSEHIINSKVAVRAPFSGTVVERHATLGEVIEPAVKLFTIADLSTLWIIADVPEKDIPLVKTGLPIEIKFSPYPDEVFEGTVTYIGDQIHPSTRTVKVRTEVDNSLGKLKPEMFATILITTEVMSDVLAIPGEAVQTDGNKKIVFIDKGNGGFEKREVSLGRQVDSFYQVVDGIKVGEKLVTKGSFLLKSEAQKGELGEE